MKSWTLLLAVWSLAGYVTLSAAAPGTLGRPRYLYLHPFDL